MNLLKETGLEIDGKLAKVFIGGNVYWFSYGTLIAFNTPELGTVIRQNEWGPTTGRHLNSIDRHKGSRVSAERFEELYQEAHP